MIKKVLILMLLMLPLGLSAQYTAGNWRLHSSFVASQAQNCVDTGEKVFERSFGGHDFLSERPARAHEKGGDEFGADINESLIVELYSR